MIWASKSKLKSPSLKTENYLQFLTDNPFSAPKHPSLKSYGAFSVGAGWEVVSSRRIREGLEALLWTKSYERPYFKWRKDTVSRNGYFQYPWELAMPQRDYHSAWNALACRQVLHKHHPFMAYYSPGREVEKKNLLTTFLHQAPCRGPLIYHLLQSSRYLYNAGLAMRANFGKF